MRRLYRVFGWETKRGMLEAARLNVVLANSEAEAIGAFVKRAQDTGVHLKDVDAFVIPDDLIRAAAAELIRADEEKQP